MSARKYTAQTLNDVFLTTTNETVVATLPGVSTGRALDVSIRGWAQLTTGANTTAVRARIRRGADITGTVVDEGNLTQLNAAAGSTEDFEMDAIDNGADLAGATYVLTLQQTAATTDGTCIQAYIEAYVPE